MPGKSDGWPIAQTRNGLAALKSRTSEDDPLSNPNPVHTVESERSRSEMQPSPAKMQNVVNQKRVKKSGGPQSS